MIERKERAMGREREDAAGRGGYDTTVRDDLVVG